MTEQTQFQFEMEWDSRTVSLEALDRALYALADRVTGTVDLDGDRFVMRCHSRGSKVDSTALEHSIRAEVNDQALRLKIAERGDPIRNLVFALAFSRTGLVESSTVS